MKRAILGVAAVVAAGTAAVLVPQAAGATGSGDSISIAPAADYNLSGTILDLDLHVKCSGC